MESKCRVLILLCFSFLMQSCCWFKKCDECFEDANLWFPNQVTNVEIDRTFQPTFVGNQLYPNGTSIGVLEGYYLYNEFFSITRFVPEMGQYAKFFWNRNVPPNFSNLEEGEFVTFYKVVVNQRKDNSIECVFQEVEEVKSVLEVKVRTEGGQILGTRTVERTVFNIPSGKHGVFSFEFEFFTCGNYEFDIELDPDGQLNETSVDDNNYTEEQVNFGLCD